MVEPIELKQQNTVRKRSVTIAGHRTSVSVEDVFWDRLGAIAKGRQQSIPDLISEIDAGRTGNLSSAIRVFVVEEIDQQRKAS